MLYKSCCEFTFSRNFATHSQLQVLQSSSQFTLSDWWLLIHFRQSASFSWCVGLQHNDVTVPLHILRWLSDKFASGSCSTSSLRKLLDHNLKSFTRKAALKMHFKWTPRVDHFVSDRHTMSCQIPQPKVASSWLPSYYAPVVSKSLLSFCEKANHIFSKALTRRTHCHTSPILKFALTDLRNAKHVCKLTSD